MNLWHCGKIKGPTKNKKAPITGAGYSTRFKRRVMKNTLLIIIFLVFVSIIVYKTYEDEQELNVKDKRIEELESEVWSLKLDKHLDSVADYHIHAFKKRADSIAGR
jgi:hypothetical protein